MKKRGLLFLFSAFFVVGLSHASVPQQQFTVTGTVTDQSGTSLPGVNILEKGTTHGTVTNAEGHYSVEVSSPNSILVFSYVGYETKEVLVGERTTINIKMSSSAIGLDEVVSIGYGTLKKKDLTGAVSRANLTNTEANSSTTLGEMLKGTVPGLNIGQVNRAGQNPAISIRGRTTIGGNKQVLVVVDGIIFSGALSELNPMDIASVNVLKDASSKAIYGAQAANGVILITTKNGKKKRKEKEINGRAGQDAFLLVE